YLCIHFVRFYWKETPLSREHAGVKCKISRRVSFPIDNLDVYSWCAPELQRLLNSNRGSGTKAPEKKEEEGDVSMTSKEEEDAQDLIARGDALAKQGEEVKVEDIGVGLPAGFQGIYELFAVVTHKGRSADSGHYVAWIREFEDNWLLFDDDQVSHVTSEDIKKLSGGGDWHTAYLTFYRAKQ
ncbi:UBP7, partial [Symbiodinium sp. KB8]